MTAKQIAEHEMASSARTVVDKPICFVIGPIGEDGSAERKRSDQVLRHIVKKALDGTYTVVGAFDISQPGIVTVQIIEQLLHAALVVADLSDGNANVYYELAIRHSVRKPVVHLITSGQKAPFDVSQMRYVPYDITNPDSVEEAWQKLKDIAGKIGAGEGLLTPIQFTQFSLAANAGQPGARDTGVLLNAFSAAMTNISEQLVNIKALVAKPDQISVPTFLRSDFNPNNSLMADMARAALDAGSSPQDKQGVITQAIARAREAANKANKIKLPTEG